jgi:hypothetical protein
MGPSAHSVARLLDSVRRLAEAQAVNREWGKVTPEDPSACTLTVRVVQGNARGAFPEEPMDPPSPLPRNAQSEAPVVPDTGASRLGSDGAEA